MFWWEPGRRGWDRCKPSNLAGNESGAAHPRRRLIALCALIVKAGRGLGRQHALQAAGARVHRTGGFPPVPHAGRLSVQNHEGIREGATVAFSNSSAPSRVPPTPATNRRQEGKKMSDLTPSRPSLPAIKDASPAPVGKGGSLADVLRVRGRSHGGASRIRRRVQGRVSRTGTATRGMGRRALVQLMCSCLERRDGSQLYSLMRNNSGAPNRA